MIYFDVYTIYANNAYDNKNTIGRKAEQRVLHTLIQINYDKLKMSIAISRASSKRGKKNRYNRKRIEGIE